MLLLGDSQLLRAQCSLTDLDYEFKLSHESIRRPSSTRAYEWELHLVDLSLDPGRQARLDGVCRKGRGLLSQILKLPDHTLGGMKRSTQRIDLSARELKG
jgi:hypothetical protein